MRDREAVAASPVWQGNSGKAGPGRVDAEGCLPEPRRRPPAPSGVRSTRPSDPVRSLASDRRNQRRRGLGGVTVIRWPGPPDAM